MKFWKKTLSAGLALTLCAGMVVPAFAADFTDLQAAIDVGPFDSEAVPTEPSEKPANGTAFKTDDGIRYGYGWNEAAKESASKGWDIWAWDDGATRNIQLNENVEFSERDKKKDSAKDKIDTQAGIVIGAGKNVSIDLNGKDIDLNPGSVLDVEAGKFYKAEGVDGEKVAVIDENGEKKVTIACNNIGKDKTAGLQTGSVIRVEENGTLTLNDGSSGGDGSITGGLGAFYENWKSNAGGIYNKGTLTMNGGAIEGNYATHGGGVYSAGENAMFTMNGGAIEGNCAKYEGGGVYNGDSGTLQMSGGVIQSNAVGETIGSVGSGSTGGGVYNRGTFTMDGGAIQSNKAGAGGGVENCGTFTMNNGSTISGNEASWREGTDGKYGGGGVENQATFMMNGGTIENNKANYGGGVRNGNRGDRGATFMMSGGVIKNNSNYDGSEDSSGLGVYNGNKFIMSGSAVISGNKTNGQATSGGGVANRGNFAMSGNSAILDNEATVGGGVSNTGDFTMKDEAAIYKNTANKQGGGVSNTGDFTMKDKTAIRNNTANGNGGGVYMSKGASSSDFNMEGDSAVYGNTANGDGGGVYVTYERYNSGRAYMKGNSSIYNNTAGGFGGGVYISGDAINYGGYFTMGDKDNPESGAPTVYGNTADKGLGSGVYASGGYLYMYGSSAIRDNAEGEAGRDIYAESNAKLNLGDSKWTVDTAESRENGENEKFDPEKAEQGANIGLKFGYAESNPSTPVTPVTPVTPGGDLGYDGGDAGDEGLEIDDPLVPLASGPVTRAQFLDYLWRHEGEPASSGACTFTDAPADHEFILALSWAEQNGIAKAYEDGTFQPDELVTVAAVREFLGSFTSVFGGNAVAVADLTTLTGADDEAVVNCDQVLAEFFGEEYVLPEDVDGLEVDIAA